MAIESYAFLPSVPGAAANGRNWAAYFESQNIPVTLILDGEATRERIESAVKETSSVTGRVWFVFIGHGAPSGGTDAVLIGMDTQQNIASINARGIPRDQTIETLGGGEKVVVLDTCFSGRSSDGVFFADGIQPIIPVETTVDRTGNTTILTAAKAHQFSGSVPGLNRPAFSYFLLGAIRGWDQDGEPVDSRKAVSFASRQLKAVSGRTQTPTESGPVLLFGNGFERQPKMKTETTFGKPVTKILIDTNQGLVFERPEPRWRGYGSAPISMLYGPDVVIHFTSGDDVLFIQRSALIERSTFYTKAAQADGIKYDIAPHTRVIGRHKGVYAEFNNEIVFLTEQNEQPWKFVVLGTSVEARNALFKLVRSAEFK